jgi:hypothetical protein
MDWSLTSYDGGSVSGSEISQTEAAGLAVDQIQGITCFAGSDKKVRTKGPAGLRRHLHPSCQDLLELQEP